MSIQYFREFEEARDALLMTRDDPRLHARIERIWRFSSQLAPGAAPRGLRWFRTMEEAQADRDAWIARRAHALRAERLGH